jgi:DNA polymerase III alpha subunit
MKFKIYPVIMPFGVLSTYITLYLKASFMVFFLEQVLKHKNRKMDSLYNSE